MSSLYLNGLSPLERQDLIVKLHSSQGGRCFICEKPIDLQLHHGNIDVDHVEPLRAHGKDDPSNLALTHDSCNRSKQASDLRVARVLARFDTIRAEVESENRGPNLSDLLHRYGGASFDVPLRREDDRLVYSLPDVGDNEARSTAIYKDDLSGVEYAFITLPLAYLHHDDQINPRPIGRSLQGLVEEFHRKRPQLHVALGWTSLRSGGRGRVKIFDGQHKVAAQVLLGVKELPIRIFFDPDIDLFITTNMNAGTSLRQVAFDKSVQRHLGSALYNDRIDRYRHDHGLPEDDESFSEKDLLNHFKGEWREMKRYVLDAVRDAITHDPENKLKGYVEYGGKETGRPLSYSTIEKTFYSLFIYGDALNTPIGYKAEEGDNPRLLEKEQILRLMNLIADTVYLQRFDPSIGTYRIENRLQKGELIPDDHLRAFRLSREEIIFNYIKFVAQIIQNYFITTGKPVDPQRLFQERFPDPLWSSIDNFLRNLAQLPPWVNHELGVSAFGAKQNYDYWWSVFTTGKTPQGQQILSEPINLMAMIQP
ncbi:MAG: HNH endonuclease [Candidatus Dormibacteria bacterium]